MKYNLTREQLKLSCINLSEEIKRDDKLLTNKDITIFNSSILPLNNSDNLLIASRGWYGNVRSWDGINFVILSLFSKNMKKLKQNILDIDPNLVKNKEIKFKEFKHKIIPHEKHILEGPEDPRLFYHNDQIYILVNELNKKQEETPRHMFVSKVNLEKLEYDVNKDNLCEELSTKFEKNWGTFIHNKKLHMLYDINPLKILEVNDDFKCKIVCNINDKVLKKIQGSYPELNFHIRNSTNLVDLGSGKYLGMGHGVLDYKGDSNLNKYFIPAIDKSKYSNDDKVYFKRFFKLYTAFFFILDMKKKEITELSPFFQLPNYESKQELIFFPTSIYLDKDNYVNISYNIGDNRSYFVKLHLDIIKISLYDKNNIDFQVNHNINPNYYVELIRNIRKLMGYNVLKKDYYKFKDVNKTLSSRGSKTKKKSKKKSKRR
tara:strand:+ start:98 stop:1390 length:1293 start_codon:yes stop_codon:yes gene_type:complete